MTSFLKQKNAPRVFISYSHDSRDHEDRVRALADRLRQDGIDAVIDQYDTAPPAGWPVWMDREIRKADFVALVCTETYLSRVEGREEPGKGRGVLWEVKLIYNLLYGEDSDVQRFIPLLLMGGTAASIPLPIRGLTHYEVQTGQGYENFYRHLTSQPQYQKPALGKLKSLPAIPPRSYPASFPHVERKPLKTVDQRNRLQMLKRVHMDWIDGVLKHSLYNVARMELGLKTKSDAVEHPLRSIVQSPDFPPIDIPTGTTVSQVFDECGQGLLILGAPGTGKTTLLLELAQALLERAEQDDSHPIPVVFNLSSWAVERRPLNEWLISELRDLNDVPKKIAQYWVETEQILPLLDGLDEVGLDARQGCVEAINDFRRGHGLLPIAVCSRISDYEALGTKLRLRTAIVIQLLTKREVQLYLDGVGERGRSLRAELDKDAALWEIFDTPLMLAVAILASLERMVNLSGQNSTEAKREQLFAHFVEAMFTRRSSESRYTAKQTILWLSWLATGLIENKQTVFYLENLHQGWLVTQSQRWLLRAGSLAGSGMVGVLTIGLAVALVLGPLASLTLGWMGLLVSLFAAAAGGLFFGVLCALLSALVGLFVEFKPVETIQITFASMSSRLGRALRLGLLAGVTFGLFFGLFYKLLQEKKNYGLLLALIGGVTYFLTALLCGEAMESRTSPNQGTRRSLRIGLVAGLIGGSAGVLGGGLFAGWVFGLVLGSIISLISFMAGGGLFCIRHLALRAALWFESVCTIPLS